MRTCILSNISRSIFTNFGLLAVALLLLFCNHAQAQTAQADSNFNFNQRFVDCEKKWVVFPKANNTPGYPFGYVYLDVFAGFTFQLSGYLSVNKDHSYTKDTSAFTTGMVKVRLAGNTRLMAVVGTDHYKELHISANPDWVKAYYGNVDSLSRYQRLGWTYNDMQQYDKALYYLNKVHTKDPHHKDTEFEMAFAYNASKRYDEAIKILEPALKNAPANMMFYRELGFAYMNKGDNDKAIEIYKNAIAQFGSNAVDENKAEMAINLAHIYSIKGDSTQKNEWGNKAKSWAPVNSNIYKMITAQGF